MAPGVFTRNLREGVNASQPSGLDTLFHPLDNVSMLDLNAFRIFDCVATLRSFSAAARALGLPKSSVSRAVALLESELGTRLMQRTTREVVLTESGVALKERCADILVRLGETVDYIGSLGSEPRGVLKISSGIGTGLHMLAEVVPKFLEIYPEVDVSVDLTSRSVDLVAENVDVAIRMGPMPDSQLVATRLGSIPRWLCCSPAYAERKGLPSRLEELKGHDIVEMPGPNGRPRTWTFSGPSGESKKFEVNPRVSVNDATSMHRMVVQGAGFGCLAAYLCVDDVHAGRLLRVLPELQPAPVDVSIVFPTNKSLSPTVRAFVDFIKASEVPNKLWHDEAPQEGVSQSQRTLVNSPTAQESSQSIPRVPERSA